ncbi:hypothetical protein KPSA3_03909 [Pseudomonas syringae pv. actinidiae]|uniref:Uncharacterized protein n=1 Tax=Pseudomonas syringae pv. actinidiae TaxID=103796 RepID=A0AAN4Q5X9_PSESF|nr:hypothetical protein KPSA3_03909 [Pseudomonas syringae pv. actinidiae]
MGAGPVGRDAGGSLIGFSVPCPWFLYEGRLHYCMYLSRTLLAASYRVKRAPAENAQPSFLYSASQLWL